MTREIPFPLFVTFWNRHLGQLTPHVHLRIARWLEGQGRDALLTAFRGCGKSTLVGLFVAWKLACDPNLRVLVVSADESLATRMVRNVRRIIERHPMAAHLIPDGPDQWAADRFTVKRAAEWRDPSVVSCGLAGNYTGMRADLIICDDVEVPGTCDTAMKREELRARLNELTYVRSAGAQMIYVGTPHAFDTIYAVGRREDIPGHTPFLAGFERLKIPARDENGIPTWPEKYDDDTLADMLRRTGFSHFQSQMMLEPMSMSKLYFDPALFHVYDDEVLFSSEVGQAFLGGARLSSCSAWWDPALARGTGDSSVLAVVFTDDQGHVWVHRAVYLRVDPASAVDDATQQCAGVAAILQGLKVPVVGLETNGLGRFLPAILRREIVKARGSAAVVEVAQTRAKSERILRAFEAPLAARMIHIHRSVTRTPFLDELRDWRPDLKNAADDGLDAVAGAMLMEPVRLSGGQRDFRNPHFWRARATHVAKT